MLLIRDSSSGDGTARRPVTGADTKPPAWYRRTPKLVDDILAVAVIVALVTLAVDDRTTAVAVAVDKARHRPNRDMAPKSTAVGLVGCLGDMCATRFQDFFSYSAGVKRDALVSPVEGATSRAV